MEEPVLVDRDDRSSLFPGIDIVSVRDLTDVSEILGGSFDRSLTAEDRLYEGRQILLVELPVGGEEDMLNAIEILEEDPLVAYAEFNIIGSAISSPLVPNDPYFLPDPFSPFPDGLWGMEKIHAAEAWGLWEENRPETRPGSHDVLVGVLDTGVDYNHVDLIGNVDANLGYNFLYDNPWWWYQDSDPMDDEGHGTHVAGTIGAVGDNGEGVVGVCWEITIIPLKIWDSGAYGSVAEFVSALAYAEVIDIPILNISGRWCKNWLQDTELNAMYDAIEAYSGILVAAAGNDWMDNDLDDFTTAFPAAFDLSNIVTVAASNEWDGLVDNFTWGSNYGETTVDLAAPGDYILSTMPSDLYVSWSGTSMAAPHVTGVAALLKGYYPSATTAQIKEAVLNSATVTPSLIGKVSTGGRLNALAAMEYMDVIMKPLLYGDVDDNGRVAPMDASLLSRYLDGWPGIVINEAAADVDADGEITPFDLVILQRHIAGWPGYEVLHTSHSQNKITFPYSA